jgi:hypothetical protein
MSLRRNRFLSRCKSGALFFALTIHVNVAHAFGMQGEPATGEFLISLMVRNMT